MTLKTSEHHFRRLWQKLCSNYRSKISVAVTLLLILFMGIGFAEMYFFTRSIVLERTHAYMQNSATSCSINIVNSIEEIEDVTLSILGNASIQDDLLTLEQEGLDEYTSYHCGMELRETLGSYALLRTEISSVCLVTKQGATYSYSKSHQQTYSRIGDMADTIYAHSGKVVWYVDDDDYQTLSCARSISYLPDLKTRGLVSVSVSESYIRSLYEELVPRDMGEVYLLDENNVVISSLTGDALGQSLTETFSTLLAQPGEDYHVMCNGNSIYISDPMPNQWRLVMLVPRAYYLDGMGRIGVIFLISAFVLACLGGMAIWGITHPLTKPIYELAHAMEDFGHGNLKAQSPVRTHDEIGMLSDTFNHMVTDMHRLYITAYEKELMRQSTELRALRMQINPHFLYNTLDTINWTARFSGADQVGDMACSLGNLLRYSLSPGDFTVLAKEVASLGDYLEIQQVRYGDKMQVEVDVDASFGNIDVPKLIIQPIVENAIVHGIEKKIEDGRIHIWAELDGDTDLLLHIDDDGVGMDEETARGLLLKQKSGDFRRSSHIGVYNVHRRIQMYYGEGYGATIHSEVGVGTSVTLRIKALREPEDPPEGQA